VTWFGVLRGVEGIRFVALGSESGVDVLVTMYSFGGRAKKTAVRGRASRTAVGGESENREASASSPVFYLTSSVKVNRKI
jgi:hypothetical protein